MKRWRQLRLSLIERRRNRRNGIFCRVVILGFGYGINLETYGLERKLNDFVADGSFRVNRLIKLDIS